MRFVQVRDKWINADHILYIDEVEHCQATADQPAFFYYEFKLINNTWIQSNNFDTEELARLHRAQLINQLENKGDK